MFDDRMFAWVLRQDREDERERRRLIQEAERARAVEESGGETIVQAVRAQSQRQSAARRPAA